jgi:hypothetical protein
MRNEKGVTGGIGVPLTAHSSRQRRDSFEALRTQRIGIFPWPGDYGQFNRWSDQDK